MGYEKYKYILTKKEIEIILNNYKYFDICSKTFNCKSCDYGNGSFYCAHTIISRENNKLGITHGGIAYKNSYDIYEIILYFDELKKLYNLRKL